MFKNPLIAETGKFMARVSYGALWGVLLSDADFHVRLTFGLCLSLIALFLSTAFIAWDQRPMRDAGASRMALHGLHLIGQVLCAGSIVLMALGAFQMRPAWAYAGALAAGTGYLACLYSLYCLVNSNIEERRGSKQ